MRRHRPLKPELVLALANLLLSPEDEWLRDWRAWSLFHGHLAGMVNGRHVYLHNLIIKAPPGFVVDHINENKIDNRRENLQITTFRVNTMKIPILIARYGIYVGVHKHWNSYMVKVTIYNKVYRLFGFQDRESARIARLNLIEQKEIEYNHEHTQR